MSLQNISIATMQQFLRGSWDEPLPEVWATNTSVLCTSVVCCYTFGSGHTNNLLRNFPPRSYKFLHFCPKPFCFCFSWNLSRKQHSELPNDTKGSGPKHSCGLHRKWSHFGVSETKLFLPGFTLALSLSPDLHINRKFKKVFSLHTAKMQFKGNSLQYTMSYADWQLNFREQEPNLEFCFSFFQMEICTKRVLIETYERFLQSHLTILIVTQHQQRQMHLGSA